MRNVDCVLMQSVGDGRCYKKVLLPPDDPIFTSPVLPVTEKFGYPLVMRRMQNRLARGVDTDNQHATWLNINPITGWAPDIWQHSVGSVIVAHPNKVPLKVARLAAVVDYVSDILDDFGEWGPEYVARKYYGPNGRRRLDKFLIEHERMQEAYEETFAAMRSGS